MRDLDVNFLTSFTLTYKKAPLNFTGLKMIGAKKSALGYFHKLLISK